MKFVIATTAKPRNFEEFVSVVRDMATCYGCELLGYVVVGGPGCYNHGLCLQGHNAEQLVSSICMQLQPAKYSFVPEDDPAVDPGVFSMSL